MLGKNRHIEWKRIIALAFCAVFVVIAAVPGFSFAKAQKERVVRVGWYDSAYNYKDGHGRRYGYAYEYQQKIAAYTGWKYEYVEGTWPELLRMLEEGKIDLLSDVSYTEKRSETMFFSDLPMGAEAFYAFISADNQAIDREDLSTLQGKRIGVYKGSIQEGILKRWIKRQNLKVEILPLTASEKECQRMLKVGEIDVLVATDIYDDRNSFVPVCKIDASDYYFAVTRERPDLWKQLNIAMNRIQDENRYYNQELFEDYFGLTGSNTSLTSGEKQWLEDHGKIRVGYKDNDLPFCAEDKTSGNLTGALKECLDLASSVGGETKVEFEPVSYPSTEEVLDALESGEVDTVFPIGISDSDGEDNGIVMTRPLLNTEMYAVVRKSDHINVLPKKNFRVAINEGNPNLTVFVERNFPNWEIVPEKKEQDCLKAVESGEVDTTLLNRYRALRSDDLPQNEQLMTVVTGKSMPLSFAVRRSEGDLYAILGKAVSQISEAAVESAIEPYVYDNGKVSVMAFLRDHWIGVVIVLTAVFLLILFLLFQRLDAERRANERERLITATELDPLTKLYNRNFFFEYANKMYRDAPNREMDAVVVNVENFHSVNELNGREFGDRVLIALGDELKSIQEESKGIAGRFESDHFDLYCGHMEDYQALFDRLQERVDNIPGNATVRIRMGVMPWQKGVVPVQMFDRARTACSIARDSYMATLIIFDEEIRQKEIYEQSILNDLRRALEEKEFLVYYQPKYYVQCETPRLSSAEALVRWKHPELGMISPGVFIPLLERNALIEKVDVFVWEEAARQVAAWKKKYGVTIPVSINLSRLDVFNPELETILDTLVKGNGLEREDLKLEVTESAYTENADQVIRVIESLREKGYEIEMDDFGSGYSSLNMLSSMPVDVLKMDRAFIQDVEHSEKDVRLVELVLNIAKNLKVPVIAEGVETEEQLQLLKGLGCDVIQGFYFSRPLPADQFEEQIIQNEISLNATDLKAIYQKEFEQK